MERIFDERLIQLSNGESKRLQISKALLSEPSILLLDNPFIGLDTDARKILENVLTEVSAKGIQIVLSNSHGPSLSPDLALPSAMSP